MNCITSQLLLTLSVALLPGVIRAQSTEGPAPDRPELQVLAHLPGEWTGTLDGDTSGGKLKLSSRWILNGYVLDTTIKLGDYQSRLLRTWDHAGQQYVLTYMDNSGSVLMMTGQWNEDRKELTASGKQGARTVTMSTQFVDDNTTQWTIKDGDNTISGTNRRDSR